MPELPDITVYLDCLAPRVVGQPLQKVRLASPFLLRSVEPSLSESFSKKVIGLHRIGKRICFDLEDDYHLVLHLMIAGRLRWLPPAAKIPGKIGLASFDFPTGALILTEAGTKRRASLHVVHGKEGLATIDPGGLEIEGSTIAQFRGALGRENHTLKRALTHPRLISGIGNAYSDEILHRAKLSPVRWTDRLTDEEWSRLYDCCKIVLREWTERLRKETGDGFPEKVTAFREEMAVHGKYKKPCPVCQTLVQRIRHADNETNYCPRCQTEGKLLADRALSKLLKGDWPKTIDEWEERRATTMSKDQSS